MHQSSQDKAAAAPPKTLTQRFLSTSLWSVAGVLSKLMLRLGSNLILTRLLLPEAFGLMAFAFTVQTAAIMLTDIGVERSIVRDADGDTDRYLKAAWTVRIVRGALVTLCMLAVALILLPLLRLIVAADSVIATPEAAGITAIIALTPLLQSAGSVNEVLAQRRLQVRRVMLLQLGSQAVGLLLTVAAVYMWPTAWTLAITTIVNVALRSALTHLLLPGPRAAWLWDPVIARRMWDYGKWLIGSSISGFFVQFGERVIFAAAVDVTVFGLYSIARLWAEAAQQMLNFMLNHAGTAALSEVIRTPGRDVTGPYGKLQRGVDLLALTGFLGFFFLSGPFIRLIYPETYHGAAELAPLLSLLALRMRYTPYTVLMLSTGKTRQLMFAAIQEAVATWIMVWFVLKTIDFQTAIIVYAASGLVSIPYQIKVVRPLLKGRDFTFDWAWLALSAATAISIILTH